MKEKRLLGDRLLGDGLEFRDVEHLRKEIRNASLVQLNRYDELADLKETVHESKTAEHEILKLKKMELRKDKDKRKEYGFTNDKDWDMYINNVLLKELETQIDMKFKEQEERIMEIETQIKVAKIRIANLKMKRENRLVFAAPEFFD